MIYLHRATFFFCSVHINYYENEINCTLFRPMLMWAIAREGVMPNKKIQSERESETSTHE